MLSDFSEETFRTFLKNLGGLLRYHHCWVSRKSFFFLCLPKFYQLNFYISSWNLFLVVICYQDFAAHSKTYINRALPTFWKRIFQAIYFGSSLYPMTLINYEILVQGIHHSVFYRPVFYRSPCKLSLRYWFDSQDILLQLVFIILKNFLIWLWL